MRMNRTFTGIADIAAWGGMHMGEQPEDSAHTEADIEARRLLESNIDGLPDAFRTVFVLRALEEMPAKDVADCLGIPEAMVRKHFFRAQGLLRKALAREIDVARGAVYSIDGTGCDRIVQGVGEKLGP